MGVFDVLFRLYQVGQRGVDDIGARRVVVRAVGDDLNADGHRPARLADTVTDDDTVCAKIDDIHRVARLIGLNVSEKTVHRYVDALVNLRLLDVGEYEYRAGVPYTVDPGSLTLALSVLTNTDGVEVAVDRRFRAILAEAGGTLAWLNRARAVLVSAGMVNRRLRRATVASTPANPRSTAQV